MKNQSARKNPKKFYKVFYNVRIQKPEAELEGAHPLARRPDGTARGWLHPLVAWPGDPPLTRPPFGLYLPPIPKTLRDDYFSRSTPLFRRCHDPKIGINRIS